MLLSPREQGRLSPSPVSSLTSPSHFVLSRLSPRPSASPKKPATFQSLMQRMKHFEDKRNASLERARRAAQQQPSQPSPVDKNSRKLVSSLVPIQHRLGSILQERDKHVKELREALTQRETEETKEMRFSPKICKISQARRAMTPDKFYEYTGNWAASTKKKLNDFRQELANKEKQGATFRPAINHSPRRSAQPIAERVKTSMVVQKKRLESQRKALTPSFSPRINKSRTGTPQQRESTAGSCLDAVMRLAESLALPASDSLCRK